MRRTLSFVLSLALAFSLVGCGKQETESGKLRVVTTLFPYYDFARAIAGDKAEVTLLLAPGREAHSFEPTPLDALTIAEADVFFCNGGEDEHWVTDMLDAVGENIGTVKKLLEVTPPEGEPHHHEHEYEHDHDHDHGGDEIEYDEHVWTSIENAVALCRAVGETLAAADEENAEEYLANCESYCGELLAVGEEFDALRHEAVRDTLVFADRFPFHHFCEQYELHHIAAFHGCATDTEPSLGVLRMLIDEVEHEDVSVVYVVDLGSEKIAEVVSECTAASIARLYSGQTVSRADFDAGVTYLDLLRRNLEALKEGLL